MAAACLVDECAQAVYGHGYCSMHYQRWRRNGAPITVRTRHTCSIDGCDALAAARSWCKKHWRRWRRYGDPTFRLPGEVVDGKRICPCCGVDKTADEYSPRAAAKPVGRRGNPDWQRALRCKACSAEARREWRASHPEYVNVVPTETARRSTRSWRMNNPDRVRAHTAQRRARRIGATVENFGPAEILVRDGWTCQICREPIDPAIVYPDPWSPSIDHRMPLVLGGAHSRENCQASHLRCNLKKHIKVA